MRRAVGSLALALVALTGPEALAGSGSPLAWSPDGQWVAYSVATPARPAALESDWIFRGRDADAAGQNAAPASPLKYRLWATRIGSDTPSTLLDDSPGPTTPPAWRQDGRALAFGRVAPTPDGRGRLEIIRIDGADRRILYSQTSDDPARDGQGLADSAVAWSPDGRFLAVPRLKPAGLAILRAENGTVVKSIESASLPAWSPLGNRLFYVLTTGPGRSAIECLDGPLGPSRRLADLGHVLGTPLPGRDGQSAVFLGRTPILLEDGSQPERVELLRVWIDGVRRDRVMPAVAGPIVPDRGIVGASLAQYRDGDNLFAAIALPDQSCQVAWYRPRERNVVKLFPVLDPMLAACDLSLSPDGQTLALRLGEPGASGLAVLCDLESMALTPLAPDPAARSAWLAFALRAVRPILRDGLPAAIVGGRAIERAVALPVPGELESNSEPLARLRRIARTARPLLDPTDAGPDDLAREEARFLFDYLREDFPAALADLDRLAAIEPTPDRRLAVLGLRGQAFAGLGDLERARDAFAYLKRIEPSRTRRTIEETALVTLVSDPIAPDAGWAEYALGRVDLLAHEAAKEDEVERLFVQQGNPDAPVPGLGLDLEPVPRPAIPEPPPPPGIPLRRGFIPRPR
ncbi:MAG TPA: hypothetical protein VGH33_19225 [Isosphaeraceae bacterium]